MSAASTSTTRTGVVERGSSAPLGASVHPGGVNFSVFSRTATLIELLLFDDRDAADSPQRHTARITTGTRSYPTSWQGSCMDIEPTGHEHPNAAFGSMRTNCSSIRTGSLWRSPIVTTAAARPDPIPTLTWR
jgi:hypothetical protein